MNEIRRKGLAKVDAQLGDGKIKQANPGALTPLYETVHSPRRVRGGVVGNKPAGRVERGMRTLMRNVRTAQAREKGENYMPTKSKQKNR